VKRGGVYGRVKAHDRVKEGGAFITVLHGVGEGQRGANDVAVRAEAAALPAHCGRKKKGAGSGSGGMARPAWPFGAGWAGSACLAIWGWVAGSACLAVRGRVGWLGHWAGCPES
jgi:hypothetical protein